MSDAATFDTAPTIDWRDRIHPAADLFPLLDVDELSALGEDIKKHGLKAPIALIRHDGEWVVLDGRNRLYGMQVFGMRIDFDNLDNPKMFVKLPARTDPVAYVISANIHRRHLNAEQKRELIGRLLKANPEKSDRQVATVVKADHKMVGAIRTELEGRGEIPHVESRTDTRGRRQPAAKVKPSELARRHEMRLAKSDATRSKHAAEKKKQEEERRKIEKEKSERLAYKLARNDLAIAREVHRVLEEGDTHHLMISLEWANEIEETGEINAEPMPVADAPLPSAEDDGLDIPASLRCEPPAATGGAS
jgi:hypothetical protein